MSTQPEMCTSPSSHTTSLPLDDRLETCHGDCNYRILSTSTRDTSSLLDSACEFFPRQPTEHVSKKQLSQILSAQSQSDEGGAEGDCDCGLYLFTGEDGQSLPRNWMDLEQPSY